MAKQYTVKSNQQIMIIAGEYSFNGGKNEIEDKYAIELGEVKQIIASVNSSICKTKISKEKTKQGQTLYRPSALNRLFKQGFRGKSWQSTKIFCEYSQAYYVNDYTPPDPRNANQKTRKPYREMDFVKNKVGVEVQFGKYAFMAYNVCAKMTIFSNRGVIAVGIEIVLVKSFADQMSTGVSYFEQFVWDLEERGTADIDIPVLILGVSE